MVTVAPRKESSKRVPFQSEMAQSRFYGGSAPLLRRMQSVNQFSGEVQRLSGHSWEEGDGRLVAPTGLGEGGGSFSEKGPVLRSTNDSKQEGELAR